MTKQTIHKRVSIKGKPFVAGSKIPPLPPIHKDDLMVVANMPYFAKSIAAVKELVSEADLEFGDGHLSMVAMDPANIAMVVYKLGNHNGISIRADKPIKVGLNLNNLHQLIRPIKAGVVTTFTVKDDKLTLTSGMAHAKMPVIKLDEKERKVPELKPTNSIVVPGDAMLEAIKYADPVSDSVTLEAGPEGVEMVARGDLNEQAVTLSTEKMKPCMSKYSVEYLKKMGVMMNKETSVKLEWAKDYPLILTINPVPAGNLAIKFILAPRVENDEDTSVATPKTEEAKKPYYETGTIEFEGKKYKTISFNVLPRGEKPEWVTVAPRSLETRFEEISPTHEVGTVGDVSKEAEKIDEGIYEYADTASVEKEDVKAIFDQLLDDREQILVYEKVD